MKKKKNFILLLGILVLFFHTGISYAVNSEDKPFNFRLNPSPWVADYDQTGARPKDTKSYVYAKVNYVKNPKNRVTGYVMARSKWSTSNASGGNYYTFNSKGVKLMTNYVRENGYKEAILKTGADPKKVNNVEGVWSPDYVKY